MNTKQKILIQARAMFMRYGMKSITMDDLSRELAVSKKTLYEHVESKADLINKVIEYDFEMTFKELARILSSSKNAMDEMLELGRFVIKQLRDISPSTWYDLQKYYREGYVKMMEFHNEHVYVIIKNNLERGINDGLYRNDLNIDIVAKLYTANTLAVVDENHFPLKKYNRENLFTEYMHYHLHGIASDEGLKYLETNIKNFES